MPKEETFSFNIPNVRKLPNAVFWGAGAPAETSQQRGLFRAATTTPCYD
jgi:hypothetical protein